MSRLLYLIAASILVVFFGSCDTSFSPSAPFEPRMVVYCVLNTNCDTQYVRVYSTYNPPDNDPSKNPGEVPVKDARVSITEQGGATFSFQPMTFPRVDTSRYTSAIDAYYAYPFRPGRGRTYALTVSSASMGTMTARTTVPGQASVEPVNPFVLSSPVMNRDDFGLSARLAPEAKGFLGHIYIDYLFTLDDRTYTPKRFEIPQGRRVINRYMPLFEETYPRPRRKQLANEVVAYSRAAYLDKISYIYDREGASIRFKQAVFYLIQFDAPVWNNYGLANRFNDRFTVRIDEPDYTNIPNGAGIFGSTTVDSLVRVLPEVIGHLPPGSY